MLTLKIRYPLLTPVGLDKNTHHQMRICNGNEGYSGTWYSNSEYQVIHAYCSVQYSDQTFKAKFNKIFVGKLDAFVDTLYLDEI